jgi:hypothetical protein
MTVEILHLSGLRGGDADQAVGALLADSRTHPDLSRLLVIDDNRDSADSLAMLLRQVIRHAGYDDAFAKEQRALKQ